MFKTTFSLILLIGLTASYSVAQQDIAEDILDTEPEIPQYEFKEKDFKESVSIQILNKITTKNYDLTIDKSNSVDFSNLKIKMHKCWHAPNTMKPESKALLQVWEQTPDEQRKEIFFGWMFASAPALSAIEHPVYDIVVLSCK